MQFGCGSWQNLQESVNETSFEKMTDQDKQQLRRFHRDILVKIEECLSDKRLFNERQARNYLGGISRATLYKLNISKVKIGRRTFWEISDLDKYIDNLMNKVNKS